MNTVNPFLARLLARFQAESITREYDKGAFLLREGETEKYLYFIVSGAARVLLLTEFEEHTIRLAYPGSFINSLASYIRQTPSTFYIEALRKTIVKRISKATIDQIVHTDPEMAQAYIQMLETLVIQQIDREMDLLNNSPKARFERVLERSPGLFQEVPARYIASYLRMTPETLSRLRKS